MAQVINSNIASLFASAALNKSANALQTAQQRLSSGLRINSVSDDPTGLVIATGYDTQIRGTNIAIKNANDAISKAQTNDGYAAQVLDNLQRLYEIAVQAGGTAAGAESTSLIAENARIAALTTATGAVTVDGAGNKVTGVGTVITVPVAVTAAAIKTEITALTAERANFGADIATFNSAVSTMQTASVNLSASYSRIMDTDFSVESANMAKNNVLQQAGIAVLAASNQTPNMVLTLLR